MGKKYLFSPLGGTDPISNERDGSFLHICRVYKPDKIYFHMSKEICQYHEQDNRYIYCLQELGKLLNHNFEYEIFEDSDLVDVFDYDFFYSRYKEILSDITGREDFTHDDTLYLNIASGTPAMKSTLLMLSTLGDYLYTPIQVTTPRKSMNNEHEDKKEYLPELQWDCNKDNNEDEFVNRCIEIKCENLQILLKLDMIKKFLCAYNYKSARMVADEIRYALPDEVYKLIVATEKRLQLCRNKIPYDIGKEIIPVRELVCPECGRVYLGYDIGKEIIPVRDGDACDIVEYILSLEIKVKKGEYADFVRGVTPVLSDLLERIIEKNCDFTFDQYCDIYTGNRNRKLWNLEALKSNVVIWRILNTRNPFKGGDVYPKQIISIIKGLTTDLHLRSLIEKIEKIECSNIRNLSAHEIVSVTDEWIKRGTGFSSMEIINYLKKACHYAGISVNSQIWSSYDDMNKMIIEKVDTIDVMSK